MFTILLVFSGGGEDNYISDDSDDFSAASKSGSEVEAIPIKERLRK